MSSDLSTSNTTLKEDLLVAQQSESEIFYIYHYLQSKAQLSKSTLDAYKVLANAAVAATKGLLSASNAASANSVFTGSTRSAVGSVP
jgi:hypothetical protein